MPKARFASVDNALLLLLCWMLLLSLTIQYLLHVVGKSSPNVLQSCSGYLETDLTSAMHISLHHVHLQCI